MTNTTAGLVCCHHHLYSSLARGMPGPATPPKNFLEILKSVWWRLDAALDEDIIYWSAALGAAEALLSGTTSIIDHHESPRAIDGSLDLIASACDKIGIRHILSYGITDRWTDSGELVDVVPSGKMSPGAQRGLAENERYLNTGRKALVGIHAAFTCCDETLEAAHSMAQKYGVGVHVHVAEAPEDKQAALRLLPYATDDWLLIHAVHLDTKMKGTIIHNPRSNMNNSVGYAAPARRDNVIGLGTDGIGADMLEEFRLAFARHREDDRTATPDIAWQWLLNGQKFFPEAVHDVVSWSYDHMDDPWCVAYTPGIRCTDVVVEGKTLIQNGRPVHFDIDEIRAKAAEQALRLFSRLESL